MISCCSSLKFRHYKTLFSISLFTMAANNTLLPSSTFSTTITFVAEMTAGGAVPNAHSNQYQRWHSLTLGSLDTSINNTPPLDNVMNTFFKTEITFFERASYRYPKPGSVALVTGKFFFTKGTPEPEIRVRADPIRVYVTTVAFFLCYSLISV